MTEWLKNGEKIGKLYFLNQKNELYLASDYIIDNIHLKWRKSNKFNCG